MRLQKYIAAAGVCSRREAEEYIRQGRVTVNGVTASLGSGAEEGDVVLLNGKRLSLPEEHTYVLLHKPRGYVTTLRDTHGRPTVAELVQDAGVRLFPVDLFLSDLNALHRRETVADHLLHGAPHPRVPVIPKLRSTIDEVSKEDFNRAVDAILKAETVYIVGMRSSTSLASFLGFYLNLLLDNVRLIHDTSVSEVYEQVFRIHEGDVFLGISFPRYSSRTIKAMQFAKSTGATAIGITDGQSSPFVGVADINLFAKSDMVSFLDSLVAPMSLINALIVAIGYQRPDNLSDTFRKLEGIWSEYEVYENLND